MGEDEAGFASAEAIVALRPLCAELSERDRRIIYLRFFHEWTQARIAEEFGVTQMQISRLLARILGQLRGRLGSLDLRSQRPAAAVSSIGTDREGSSYWTVPPASLCAGGALIAARRALMPSPAAVRGYANSVVTSTSRRPSPAPWFRVADSAGTPASDLALVWPATRAATPSARMREHP